MLEEQNNNLSSPSFEPGDEESPEFLKREDVSTMAKDVAMAREDDALKERERISKIQKESQTEAVKRGITVAPIQLELVDNTPQQIVPIALAPHPTKQPDKLFIRIVIGGIVLFFILNAVALGFWYFTHGY